MEFKEGMLRNICIFCGSKDPKKQIYAEKTKELAQEMIKRKLDLVYGGGTVGLMGIVANAVQEGGGSVIGFIPAALSGKEVSGAQIGNTVVVKDMHERKLEMYKHADAFIALPGGYGTFEELLETMTWFQLGIHSKPIGVLNVDGYYDSLVQLFKRGVEEGFITEKMGKMLIVDSDPKNLIQKLSTQVPPQSEIKWITEVDQV